MLEHVQRRETELVEALEHEESNEKQLRELELFSLEQKSRINTFGGKSVRAGHTYRSQDAIPFAADLKLVASEYEIASPPADVSEWREPRATAPHREKDPDNQLYSAYQDIEKAFREIDVSQSGFVSLDYLKSVINGFIFPLPNEIFQELMNRMNEKPAEMITDAELACDHAHYYLVIKARTRWYDLVRNFQEFDSEENGIIQPRALKKFAFPFGIPITLEGLKQLWASLGISIHDSKLSYFDFLRAIEDGRASEYQQKQKQAVPPASFAELSVEQTLIMIKETVTSSWDLLYKAFVAG
ncbi:EF-hand calcium-binding domain-containing protein 6 [Geothlypis trichas]